MNTERNEVEGLGDEALDCARKGLDDAIDASLGRLALFHNWRVMYADFEGRLRLQATVKGSEIRLILYRPPNYNPERDERWPARWLYRYSFDNDKRGPFDSAEAAIRDAESSCLEGFFELYRHTRTVLANLVDARAGKGIGFEMTVPLGCEPLGGGEPMREQLEAVERERDEYAEELERANEEAANAERAAEEALEKLDAESDCRLRLEEQLEDVREKITRRILRHQEDCKRHAADSQLARETIERLKAEKRHLESQGRESQLRVEAAEAATARLQEEYDEERSLAHRDLARLRSSEKACGAEIEKLRDKKVKLEAERASLFRSLERAEEANEDLAREIGSLRDKLAQTEGALAEALDADQNAIRVKEWQRRCNALDKRYLEKSSALEKKIDALQAEVRRLREIEESARFKHAAEVEEAVEALEPIDVLSLCSCDPDAPPSQANHCGAICSCDCHDRQREVDALLDTATLALQDKLHAEGLEAKAIRAKEEAEEKLDGYSETVDLMTDKIRRLRADVDRWKKTAGEYENLHREAREEVEKEKALFEAESAEAHKYYAETVRLTEEVEGLRAVNQGAVATIESIKAERDLLCREVEQLRELHSKEAAARHNLQIGNAKAGDTIADLRNSLAAVTAENNKLTGELFRSRQEASIVGGLVEILKRKVKSGKAIGLVDFERYEPADLEEKAEPDLLERFAEKGKGILEALEAFALGVESIAESVRSDHPDDFAECPTCAEKPGAPLLCPSCIHNRDLIWRLQKEAREGGDSE